MKSIGELYKYLESRKDFQVIDIGFDGGSGLFIKGPMKRMSVIWSWAGGWDHVSIDGKNRMPTWDEMCELKDMFFDADECCVQYHPAKSEYIDNIPYCLHIWKPIEKYSGSLPCPPTALVGMKDVRLG